MDESTRNRIARYVRRGERSAPPEFVGRKTELNRFREFVEIVNEFTEGATMVVHGAPGVGKTSLLREFENTAGRDGTARIVRLRRKSFASSDQFLTDLAAGLNVNGGLRLKELKGKANFLVARGEVTFERVEGGSFTQAIRDLCTWGVGGTGVIVALDEAQELADLPERSSAKDIFLELHEGIPGVKIGAVYVGLSNLPLVLEHLASPRLDSDLKMPMPLFKEGETANSSTGPSITLGRPEPRNATLWGTGPNSIAGGGPSTRSTSCGPPPRKCLRKIPANSNTSTPSGSADGSNVIAPTTTHPDGVDSRAESMWCWPRTMQRTKTARTSTHCTTRLPKPWVATTTKCSALWTKCSAGDISIRWAPTSTSAPSHR